MNTAFNWQHHLNRWCVVLSPDSIYVVESMCYANPTKNKTVESRRLNPEFYDLVLKFWIQSSDLSAQTGFHKKNR